MPASYLHEVIARESRRLLREERSDPLTGLLEKREAAFLTGTLGPDPFFFYRFFYRAENRRALCLGIRLHCEYTSDFLLALLRRAGAEPEAGSEAARAYALGFLSHYAADTVVHPFVYARSFDRDGRYSTNLHCGLEAAMDTAAHREQGGRGIPRRMGGIAALTQADVQAIAPALTGAVGEVFPDMAVGAEAARDSFRWALRINRLLHSPSGVKRRILSWLAALLGKPGLVEAHALPRRLPAWDFANRSSLAWSSPWTPGEPSRQTLAELTESAARRGAELMSLAGALWRGEISEDGLRAALGDLHYDSGLPWRDTEPVEDGWKAEEAGAHAQERR